MKKSLLFLCTFLCSLGVWAQTKDISTKSLWKATAFNSLKSGDIIIIGNDFGNALKSNQTVTKSAANINIATVETDGLFTISYDGAKNLNDLAWTVANGTNGKMFYVYGSDKNLLYLAKTGDNNALGIGEGTSNTEWVLGNKEHLLLNYGNGRYCGKYVSGSDWRTYNTEDANNYKSGSTLQTLIFYVLQDESSAPTTTYNINIADNITNGSVSANATTAAEGATVTLTATPDDGYELSSWSVTNASTSKAISVTDNKFTMPAANVNVSATFAPIGDAPSGEVTYYITDISEILPTDDVILSWKKVGESANGNTYAITNNNGTTSAPDAVQMNNIKNDAYTTDRTDIVWNIARNEEGTFVIYSYSDTSKYLYCTNSNDGVRVGTGQAKTFQIKSDYLYEDGTKDARYLGIYNSADVRCYTSINSNIKDQKLAFYVNKNIINIGSTGYATYVTPKALDFTGSDVTAYVVSSVSNSTLTLTEATKVPAGQAIIVKGKEGANKVSVIKTADAVTNKMESAAEDIVVANDPDNIYYILANGGNGVGFYKAKGTIAAGKGYIKVPVSSDAKASLSFNFGTPTGINATENVKGSNVVYNLNGQRVSNNAKGIVIINGKKFINK